MYRIALSSSLDAKTVLARVFALSTPPMAIDHVASIPALAEFLRWHVPHAMLVVDQDSPLEQIRQHQLIQPSCGPLFLYTLGDRTLRGPRNGHWSILATGLPLEDIPREMVPRMLEALDADHLRCEGALNASKVLMGSADAVIITDRTGRIGFANVAARRLLAWQDTIPIHATVDSAMPLFDPVDLRAVEHPIVTALGRKAPIRVPHGYVLRRPDNTALWIEDVSEPLFSESGELSGAVMHFHEKPPGSPARPHPETNAASTSAQEPALPVHADETHLDRTLAKDDL